MRKTSTRRNITITLNNKMIRFWTARRIRNRTVWEIINTLLWKFIIIFLITLIHLFYMPQNNDDLYDPFLAVTAYNHHMYDAKPHHNLLVHGIDIFQMEPLLFHQTIYVKISLSFPLKAIRHIQYSYYPHTPSI